VVACFAPAATAVLRGKNRPATDAKTVMHVTMQEPGSRGRPAVRAYRSPSMGQAVGDRSRAEAPQDWVAALGAVGPRREEALAALHDLLLRGAYFELRRRRGSLSHVSDAELADLATQAAADAMMAILAKLHTFRGDSRFTTWAYKFVLLEAGVKLRRRAWQGREVNLDDAAWPAFADGAPSAQQTLEEGELLAAVRTAVTTALTPHQREVFIALALNGVPIDVLAERLGTTRGALYKTLHDARRKLRAALAAAGLAIGDDHTGRTR
jgi:RNA polymerase sigma-70 factor (ECF subfamily)